MANSGCCVNTYEQNVSEFTISKVDSLLLAKSYRLSVAVLC